MTKYAVIVAFLICLSSSLYSNNLSSVGYKFYKLGMSYKEVKRIYKQKGYKDNGMSPRVLHELVNDARETVLYYRTVKFNALIKFIFYKNTLYQIFLSYKVLPLRLGIENSKQLSNFLLRRLLKKLGQYTKFKYKIQFRKYIWLIRNKYEINLQTSHFGLGGSVGVSIFYVDLGIIRKREQDQTRNQR